MIVGPFFYGDGLVWHLARILPGAGDGYQATFFSGDVYITGCPGGNAVNTYRCITAGCFTIFNQPSFFAVACNVLVGCIQEIVCRTNVDGSFIVSGFIGVYF